MEKEVPGVEPSLGEGKGERVLNNPEMLGAGGLCGRL